MLSRAFWRAPAIVRPREFAAARRVTTDAASSHAEKEDVPTEDDKPFQVKLSDESFETYELDPPPYILHTTKAELKKMYYDMVSIRSVSLSEVSISLRC